jgi:hypothetical protein
MNEPKASLAPSSLLIHHGLRSVIRALSSVGIYHDKKTRNRLTYGKWEFAIVRSPASGMHRIRERPHTVGVIVQQKQAGKTPDVYIVMRWEDFLSQTQWKDM